MVNLIKLLKWNGVLTVGAGITFILVSILIDLAVYGVFTTWAFVFLLAHFLTAWMLLSLTGMYLSQIEALGGLGVIGYILAFVGTSVTGGVMFYSFVLASLGQELGQYYGPGARVGGLADAVMIFSGVALLSGWMIFGVACMLAKQYPRWIGFLLGFGLILGLPLRLPIPGGRSLGFGVWGIGFISMGYLMWKKGNLAEKSGEPPSPA